MKETPEQCINRVIDRLKDILDKGNRAEKRQLAELLGHDENNVYSALIEVEDVMQQRLDLAWTGEDDSEFEAEILKFPDLSPPKRRIARK
jgi:hypothetical protein